MTEMLKGRRVLVTGADGFIGSHLVERLVSAGAEVRAFVFYNSWNSIGWLADTPPDVRSAIEIFPGDVRDDARVAEAVAGCDYVFHLASLIAIPYSYVAPRAYVDTNLVGGLNVLQACRRSDTLVRLVHTSTSEVYGTAQQVPIPETHPLVGQSPYSASKIGADAMADSFHRSFGLPVVTARPFNTFGPRQTARAVIPTIASQLLSGAEELRLGALTPTRDFNFATDTADGMIALATCAAAEGRVVNIGSGEEWSIEQTARMLMEICGRDVPIVTESERLRPENSEVNRLLSDNRLIAELTGWQRKISFREGLSCTAGWISENLDHFDPNRYAR
ncbi:MAG: GDP-mannose 4,6-dehydratase [Rhodospirillaceae bacterium]